MTNARDGKTRGRRLSEGDGTALTRALSDDGAPALINVAIPSSENVLPMVPPGAANRDMVGAGTI